MLWLDLACSDFAVWIANDSVRLSLRAGLYANSRVKDLFDIDGV